MSEPTFFPITDASFGSELSPEAFDMLAGRHLASLGPNEAVVRPEWTQSKETRRRKFLAALVAGVQAGIDAAGGGTQRVFSGADNPNGTQEATGPAIYLQTDVSPPTEWFKVTEGTSNNEWVSSGGSGGFVPIYSGATTTPQAVTWAVLDGRVKQVGLGVSATTGTTSIFIDTGKTLDGSFNLTPIGDTLASFQISGCTVGTFSPGVLANLSYLGLNASTLDQVDVTGCQNQLVVVAANCTIPVLVTAGSTSLYSITLSFGGQYGDIDLTGCSALVTAAISINHANSITVSNCDALTALAWNGGDLPDSFGVVSVSDCAALASFTLTACTATSISVSNCPTLGYFELQGVTCPSVSGLKTNPALTTVSFFSDPLAPNVISGPLDFAGMTQLQALGTQGSTFGDIDASGSGLVALTGNTSTTAAALDFSGCLSLTTVDFSGSTFTSMDLSGCLSISGVNLNNCSFTSVNFSGSFSAGAGVLISGATFPTIDFTGLTGLGTLDLRSSTFTSVNLAGCTGLTSLNAELAVLTDILNFNDCRALVTVNLDYTAMPAVDVTGFTALTSLSVGGVPCASITGLGDCDSLVTLHLSNATVITSLDLSGCLGPFTLTGLGMTSLTTLNMSGCTNAVSANVSNLCPALTSVDLSGCASLVTFITGRTATTGTVPLSAITITSLPACRNFRSAFTSLPVANINAILVALDANGLTGGSVYLQGGANAAPTGAGATAKTSLQGKGWTVFTN